MTRYLTPEERETVLTMNDADQTAEIFTHQRSMITKLSKNPSATLLEEGYFGKNKWARYELPVNLVSLRSISKKKAA